MRRLVLVTLLTLPRLVWSQSELVGRWKGHYPANIADQISATGKARATRDSIIITIVFKKDHTGYIRTISYTSNPPETSGFKFQYAIVRHDHTSHLFIKPQYKKGLKFNLNADTLYFTPTRKETLAESIDLIYEMRFLRVK